MRTAALPTLVPARRRLVAPLVLASVAGAATLVGLARATARRDTAPVDERARRNAKKGRRVPALRRAASAASPGGKWWSYLPASLAIGATLVRGAEERRRGVAAAGSVVLAALLSAVLNKQLERHLPQPPAPPGRDSRTMPVFPSGHTLGPAAVALAASWVLVREGRLPAAPAAAGALAIPLVTATQRLIDEMHWASDVAGGYAAGASIAAASCLVYELAAG